MYIYGAIRALSQPFAHCTMECEVFDKKNRRFINVLGFDSCDMEFRVVRIYLVSFVLLLSPADFIRQPFLYL